MNLWIVLYAVALIAAAWLSYESVLGKYRNASQLLRSAQLVAAALCFGWSVLGIWLLTSHQLSTEALAVTQRIRAILRAAFIIILIIVILSPEYRRVRGSQHARTK